jgi:redox-sensitive bicupin YhaK (pirin superfamily)
MSNIQLIIEEREASIGSFLVGRLLPFRSKRMVGPFAFIDHMGPVTLSETESFEVLPHPHIGLSTLTFLFEGSIMHRDSLRTEIEINPGEVNWMTAGKGIVHSERSPAHLHNKKKNLHGLQIWVALPKHLEQMEPTFYHASKKDLPIWQEGALQFTLIAGSFADKQSPVPVYSPMYFIEIKSTKKQVVNLENKLFGESALYVLHGNVQIEGNTFDPKQLLVAKDATLCSFEMEANSTVYIFGGEAFPEERYIYWNFVASDKNLIEKAKERWKNQAFDKVPSETDFVKLP